jgi:hypothetical protein
MGYVMETKFINHRVDGTALQLILVRYARRLIGDQKAAEHIVLYLLIDQHEYGILDGSRKVRLELKEELCLRCFRYRQLQIFDRPVIKLPLKKNTLSKN